MSEESLADLAAQGYLPTDVDTRTGEVALRRLSGRGFQEVWYADTVAAAGAGSERTVPFRSFTEQFADRRTDGHLCLIGHTSRCGSTLLANLLTLRPSTMVLKEPDFVTVPAGKIALAADEAEARTYAALLRALLDYSGTAAAAAGRHLTVKVTSWTVPVVLDVLGKRDDTTWLFVWRDPEDVVASNMARPSTWGRDTENGRAARHLAGVPGRGAADTVRFYARTWCRTADGFLSAPDGVPWRHLDYRQLVRDKERALQATETWLGLASGTGLPDGFEQQSRRYSKGERVEVFDPAKKHLRRPLEADAADEVGRVTRDVLTALREDRLHRLL